MERLVGDDVDRRRQRTAVPPAQDPRARGALELLAAAALGERVELVAAAGLSFVSSAGRPSASKRTNPSTTESFANTRPIGPGQWTFTERPAISDAIAESRCSLPERFTWSSVHQPITKTSTAAAASLIGRGVVG